MAKPPQMSGVEVVNALEQLGFEKAKSRSGSHQVMRHPDGRTTTVPVHRSDIVPNTLRSIMKQAGVTAEELKNPRKARRAQEAVAEQAADQIVDPTRGVAPAYLATGETAGDPQARPAGARHGAKQRRSRSR
jgi:predicted RNA binding protein YcfA (HicA-like mRNA interferase family)